jgi:hypothetical protein
MQRDHHGSANTFLEIVVPRPPSPGWSCVLVALSLVAVGGAIIADWTIGDGRAPTPSPALIRVGNRQQAGSISSYCWGEAGCRQLSEGTLIPRHALSVASETMRLLDFAALRLPETIELPWNHIRYTIFAIGAVSLQSRAGALEFMPPLAYVQYGTTLPTSLDSAAIFADRFAAMIAVSETQPTIPLRLPPGGYAVIVSSFHPLGANEQGDHVQGFHVNVR